MWQVFVWECNCVPRNPLTILGGKQIASCTISALCNCTYHYQSASIHTHNYKAWQEALDKHWTNPRNPKGVKRVKPILCMKIETFFLREKPSSHLSFSSHSFLWLRFRKHLLHPQTQTLWVREWHWKHEKPYPNPNPLVAFRWRLNGGDSKKLNE